MRHSVITMIIILTIPTLCLGSVGPDHHLDVSHFEVLGFDDYRLELEEKMQSVTFNIDTLDLTPNAGEGNMSGHALDDLNGGIPGTVRSAPRDMVSMMSFVWAEMFGGVDIVAEVKDFARQMKGRGRFLNVSRSERRDSRSKWKFIVAFRIDNQTEVAAQFRNRGWFLRESKIALEINTLDPISEEVGLTMAYCDGDFDIRADRMTLTETAAARVVVKF